MVFQYFLVLDPVYFVMSKLINLISTWTINKILVPFYKYALKAQINLLWQLYNSVSVRGGLTLDEGIYIAQIVAQTGDFVFEMSVLCIACGFFFVMVIIFSWFKVGGLVSQSVLFMKISLPHSSYVAWPHKPPPPPPPPPPPALTIPSGHFHQPPPREFTMNFHGSSMDFFSFVSCKRIFFCTICFYSYMYFISLFRATCKCYHIRHNVHVKAKTVCIPWEKELAVFFTVFA